MSRRGFLAGVVGIAGAGVWGGVLRPQGEGDGARSGLGGSRNWDDVRAQFPLDPSLIHLSGMLFTSHPTPVREAIDEHRRGLDENPARYVLENDRPLRRQATQAAGAYFGADPASVALTDSTTMGLSILYQGLDVGEGDEVLTTTHDHYSTWYNLDLLTKRRGVKVRKVSLYDEAHTFSQQEAVEKLVGSIREETKAVAITWVHSDTGVKLPVSLIAARIAALNERRAPQDAIRLCVDGVHGFGVEDEDMGSLGCDFFVAGCHKWLHGPRGTGVVYARRPGAWEGMLPLIPPFGVKDTQGLYFSPGGFHAFEHRWALPAAFAFHQGIGKGRVQGRIRELATQLKEGVAQMPKAQVHTPMDPAASAGIVGFSFEGASPKEVVGRLLDEGIVISQAPYGLHCLRGTPGLANTPEEIDATLRALHRYGRA